MKSFSIKIWFIALISLGTFLFLFSKSAITQSATYHQFVDQRPFLGIPNGQNVLSNVLFLITGLIGLKEILKHKSLVSTSWIAFFTSILLIAPGSAYYHWAPSNFSLIWDRLPMSFAFMAFYVILLSELVHIKCAKFLPWALMTGMLSVLTWVATGDLRFYLWIQFSLFATVPLILILFPSRYTHKSWYALALLVYGFAKWAEVMDKQIFEGTSQLISGHSLKHILASLGLAGMWWMVKIRTEIEVSVSRH
jgi:hypothetical protein